MPTRYYPMLPAPRFDPKIWGGRRLETILGKTLPTGDRYGESLESDAESRVMNGPHSGRKISELIKHDPVSILGYRGQSASEEFGDFPLLAKFIDATDVLSVQVHPDDDEARPLGKRGKTEAWHILHAEPGARLITGLKSGVSRDDIAGAIEQVRLGELVIEQPVSAGDTLLIPAGTTHAIGAGILLYEIQQASDVTFRMYDWGRLDDSGNPRTLHVRESLDVVKPDLRTDLISSLNISPGRTMLTACRYFALERWELPLEQSTIPLDGGSFRLISSLSGKVQVSAGDDPVELACGQTVLIPAESPSVSVTGDGTLLVSYVPDITIDVLQPLRSAGHADEHIDKLAGILGHLSRD